MAQKTQKVDVGAGGITSDGNISSSGDISTSTKITIGAGEITRNSTNGELEYSKDGVSSPMPISQGFLGEVKTSIFNEPDFQTIAGTGWILMDGRPTVGTDLDLYIKNVLGNPAGFPNVPDTRAEFLRGNDNGGSTYGARGIDSGRTVGSSQGDLTTDHQHTGDSHNHASPTMNTADGNVNEMCSTPWGREGVSRSINFNYYSSFGYGIYSTTHDLPLTSGALNVGTTGYMTNRNSDEVRPRNVSVNFYMKVNY